MGSTRIRHEWLSFGATYIGSMHEGTRFTSTAINAGCHGMQQLQCAVPPDPIQETSRSSATVSDASPR